MALPKLNSQICWSDQRMQPNQRKTACRGFFITDEWKLYQIIMHKHGIQIRKYNRIKSLTLLLKCLKIMENATFLSNGNQVDMCSLPVLLVNLFVYFYRCNLGCLEFYMCDILHLYCIMHTVCCIAFIAWWNF